MLSSLGSYERVKIERRRLTASLAAPFADDQSLSERPHSWFMRFEQPDPSADTVTCRAIASNGNLLQGKTRHMVSKADTSVLDPIECSVLLCTKDWYRVQTVI